MGHVLRFRGGCSVLIALLAAAAARAERRIDRRFVPPQAVVVHVPLGNLRIKAARADTGRVEAGARCVRVVGWKGKGRLEIDLVKTKAP